MLLLPVMRRGLFRLLLSYLSDDRRIIVDAHVCSKTFPLSLIDLAEQLFRANNCHMVHRWLVQRAICHLIANISSVRLLLRLYQRRRKLLFSFGVILVEQ